MESVILGVKRVGNGIIVVVKHNVSPKRGVGFETFVCWLADASDSLFEQLVQSVGLPCTHSRPYKGYVNIYLDKLKKG